MMTKMSKSADVMKILVNLRFDPQMEGRGVDLAGIASLERARENELAFCQDEGEKGVQSIAKSSAGMILCKSSLRKNVRPRKNQVIVFLDDPRLAFAVITNAIFLPSRTLPERTSSRACISRDAKIGSNCYIGDFVTIGPDCTIGDDCVIYEHAYLANCRIGRNCRIGPGAMVGHDGFGFERHADGHLEKFPQIGRVLVGDNVEVFANAVIDRGSLSDTIIGEGSRIGALVHVAHNDIIGKNTVVAPAAIIGGSVSIGNSCWLGLNSVIRQKVIVGSNAIVGANACVIGDVVDNDVVAGVPAKSIREKTTTKRRFMMAAQRHKT